MVKIAAAGSNEFIVGFQLAGIKDTIGLGASFYNELRNMKERKDIGIIVIEEKIMEALEPYQRAEIESSVEPVFIQVSAKSEQDSLKRLIKKSVGVDLWK